ncbi:transposase [Streptomyces diastatochromogenes]|nr:transposase [Streptomyces diastatochromogenes]
MWTWRQLIYGIHGIHVIRWRTRTGAPWRDVPERYGPWDRAYDPFHRWQRDGTWARILTRRQAGADAKGLIIWDVNVDSAVCRAHRHAVGAAERGTSRRSRPAAYSSKRLITASDGPAVDWPAKSTSPSGRGRSPCPW